MRPTLAVLGLLLVVCLACDGAEQAQRTASRAPVKDQVPYKYDEPWVVERETAGSTTTVTNISGSKWGGVAALREDLTIGVEAGEDPYMFGRVFAIWATDELIYVVDTGAGVVRVFDADGTFVRDLGGRGQGPGEYQEPTDVAVADDGKVFVHDRSRNGVIVYAPDGSYLDQWGWDSPVQSSMTISLGSDGTPWIDGSVYLDPLGSRTGSNVRRAMRAVGPEGVIGEPLLLPETDPQWTLFAKTETGQNIRRVPFAPNMKSTLAPSGALVSGYSDRYRFEVTDPGGAKVVVIREVDLVPVLPDERRFRERWIRLKMGRWESGWSWSGPPIPESKPAFSQFYPDRSGRVLLSRLGPGVVKDGCDQTPAPAAVQEGTAEDCWSSLRTWDMFDLNGDFLGEVPFPEYRLVTRPFVRGGLFYLGVEDEYGTHFVKRYRLVLPGEE